MPKSVPSLTSAPAPVAPYSVATEANGFVFISGQVAFDPASGDRVDGGVAAEAEQVMTNIGTILEELGLGYGDIVKTSIFVVDIGEFGTVNEVYGRYFESEPPARSTFEVAALPLGFNVEIEVIAAR